MQKILYFLVFTLVVWVSYKVFIAPPYDKCEELAKANKSNTGKKVLTILAEPTCYKYFK